jgi:hypothetical protein
MKKNLYILFLGLLLSACDKDLKVYKDAEIRGKLILEDNLTGISGAIASEGLVYLSKGKSYTTINDDYLYSAKADKDGVFKLLFQPKKQDNVKFTAKYTNSQGILYQEDHDLDSLLTVSLDKEMKISLKPVYPKGILKITWTQGASPVVGAEVFLFTNEQQAGTIGNATPDGIVQKTTTNLNGIALFYGLDMGTYYVAARTKAGGVIADVAPSKTNLVTSDIEGDPQLAKSVVLTYPVSIPLQSIDVTVNVGANSTAEPLTRFYVYIFTSKEQAETVADNPVSGYIKKDSTDATGFVSLKNLPKQKYYIGVQGQFVGQVLKHDYKQVDMTNTASPYVANFNF